MINADLKELNFISDFDGLNISAIAAVPLREFYGVVQIVHGMCEHKERYFDFMDYLAEQGFASVIHDNRGHGHSVRTSEDLGYMYEDGGKGFIADIAQLNGTIHQMFPDMPCFMMAHSMGSLGARCFLKENDDKINGLIILGSPSYSRLSKPVRAICAAVSRAEKSHERISRIDDAFEKLFNRGFGSVKHSWICSQKEVVEKFNSDPLTNFIYTLNGYEALLYLMKEAYNKKGWQKKALQLPVRFISGKKDPVMLSEKKFFKSLENLRKKGYESISHRLFDNMRHEILNEKNNIIVYRDIAKTLFSWVDRINQTSVN